MVLCRSDSRYSSTLMTVGLALAAIRDLPGDRSLLGAEEWERPRSCGRSWTCPQRRADPGQPWRGLASAGLVTGRRLQVAVRDLTLSAYFHTTPVRGPMSDGR